MEGVDKQVDKVIDMVNKMFIFKRKMRGWFLQ